MSPLESYRIKKSQSNLYLILGTVLISFSIISFILMGKAISLPFGILMLVIAFVEKDKEVVKLFYDHIEIKAAIAAPLHLIKYSDIIEFNDENQKKVFLKVYGQNKKIWLPLARLETKDASKLVENIKAQITNTN